VNGVDVLVSSFDGYSRCWGALAHGIRKYWPDCPYRVHLITNSMDPALPRITVLKVGDMDWSRRMLAALGRLAEPYVMYFQEDYWLTQTVDTTRVEEYVALMDTRDLNYIRLVALPHPDRDFPGDTRLGVIAADAPYRTSLQLSIWRREVLRELLVPGETPWEFELEGTRRSRDYGPTFLSVKRFNGNDHFWGMHYVCTAVNAGRWARAAKEYARDEGLAIDFGHLPAETLWHEFKRSGRTGAFVGRWAHRLRMLVVDPMDFARQAYARACRARSKGTAP